MNRHCICFWHDSFVKIIEVCYEEMAAKCFNSACVRRVVDVIISFLLTAHLVVMFWRGTWNLLDVYIIPDDIYIGSWISYIGGILLCVMINSLFPVLDQRTKTTNKVPNL